MKSLPQFGLLIALWLGVAGAFAPATAEDFVGPPAPPDAAPPDAVPASPGQSPPASTSWKSQEHQDFETGLKVFSLTVKKNQAILELSANQAEKIGELEQAQQFRNASAGFKPVADTLGAIKTVDRVYNVTQGDAMPIVDAAVDKLCKTAGAKPGELACSLSYDAGKAAGRWIEEKCKQELGASCGETAALYWGEKFGDAFGGDPISMAQDKMSQAFDNAATAYGDWQQCRQDPQHCEGTPENEAWKASLAERNRQNRFDALDQELEKATSSSGYSPPSADIDAGATEAASNFSNQSVQINGEFSARNEAAVQQMVATQQQAMGMSTGYGMGAGVSPSPSPSASAMSGGQSCEMELSGVLNEINRASSQLNSNQECAALQSGLNSLRLLDSETRRCNMQVDLASYIRDYQAQVSKICGAATASAGAIQSAPTSRPMSIPATGVGNQVPYQQHYTPQTTEVGSPP